MYRPLATLIVKTGIATGIALLLTLGTLMTSAPPASAAECPEGTAPVTTVDGVQECAVPDTGEATPEPPPTPPPTGLPTTDDPGTAPPEEPTPTAVPESSPAVVLPAAPAPVEPSAEVVTPTPASVEPSETPQPTATATPTPAVVAPDPPANAELTGVMAPGDGPRLLWAVVAGASASGLLAAIVAFYLVSIRPYFLARRRPGALG